MRIVLPVPLIYIKGLLVTENASTLYMNVESQIVLPLLDQWYQWDASYGFIPTLKRQEI